MPLAGPLEPDAPKKPIILHLGEPIRHHLDLYDRLRSRFEFKRPPTSDLERSEFIRNLRDRTWGDFTAIMRPFWNTGGEMGKWDREIIDLLPRTVRVYASAGAGYDWVDTYALAERGILYCNARGASTEAVSIMALYQIIAVFRNMAYSHLAARSLSRENFNEAHFNLPARSHNPQGHTLGIIGLGDIGFAIAKKVHLSLGMEIIYNDIQQKPRSHEQEVQATFFRNLEDMLSRSDCVLLAAPFSGSVLITAELLAKFKSGSRFVNIARGSLVDEEALADNLESGHLSGAGLDVHANEPDINPRLANNWQVSMTSHTGGGALETWIAFEKLAMENVEQVLTGGEALTPVNGHLITQREQAVMHANGHSTDDDDARNINGDRQADAPAVQSDSQHQYSSAHSGMNGAMHHSTNGGLSGSSTMEMSGNMHHQTSIVGGN